MLVYVLNSNALITLKPLVAVVAVLITVRILKLTVEEAQCSGERGRHMLVRAFVKGAWTRDHVWGHVQVTGVDENRPKAGSFVARAFRMGMFFPA